MFHKKPPRWEDHLVRETVGSKKEYEEGGMTKEKPAVMEVWKVKRDEVENKCKERKVVPPGNLIASAVRASRR